MKANKANKANSSTSEPAPQPASNQAVETKPATVVASAATASKPAKVLRTIEAIQADIDVAMASRDISACQKLFDELKAAEARNKKLEREALAANAELYSSNKQTLCSYLAEAMQLALSEFAKANGDMKAYIGEPISTIRITMAGTKLADGTTQANTSAAINVRKATKASSGEHKSGNFNAGERGNVRGTGMSQQQIVEKFGTAEEIAEYNSLDAKAGRNRRYQIVQKLVKANFSAS